MDRKYCRTCRYTGYDITGSMWNGCNYICDTGEKRPRIGEWCLAYKYCPTGRNSKAVRKHREDLTEEHRRITEELSAAGTSGNDTGAAEKNKRGRPRKDSTTYKKDTGATPEPVSRSGEMSRYDGFRMWLDIMMS